MLKLELSHAAPTFLRSSDSKGDFSGSLDHPMITITTNDNRQVQIHRNIASQIGYLSMNSKNELQLDMKEFQWVNTVF
jgi:hypothetical protein